MSALELHLQLANEANDYARSRIVHGCTQLENNDLPVEYFEALNNAVLKQVRALINQTRVDPYRLLTDDDVYDYEKTISLTSKYSLGNCYELALQAMDYFLTTTNQIPSSNVEVLSIDGEKGDHIFLVIGRSPESNVNDINSWGTDAVICDPWSNQVYCASEWKDKLKTFYRTYNKNGTITNCVTGYDAAVHSLKVILDIHQLKSHLNKSTLKENYINELNLMEWTLKNHKTKLETRSEKLLKKYGSEDEKYQVIGQKIGYATTVLSMVEALRTTIPDTEEDMDFRDFHRLLRKNLKQLFENVQEIITLTSEERAALSGYRHPNNLLSLMRTTINVSPPTEKTIRDANEELVKNLTGKKL
ncbi:hypothetical protein [Legionella cardiaca]|uniref:Uncharacterized protein n=1 Tax=Legionella cardiaca TaxID=1071983 RepID=A0ABY8ANC6_9GAMM|nr:hypothetical protein [Legionella cardiaca]WED42068.1 hypothetical protein PXX05_08990 [Legionella cardiaca]